MTAKARGANSGVTAEKPPVTAAGFNAVVSTAMADCAFAFVANTVLNAHATRRERLDCFIVNRLCPRALSALERHKPTVSMCPFAPPPAVHLNT